MRTHINELPCYNLILTIFNLSIVSKNHTSKNFLFGNSWYCYCKDNGSLNSAPEKEFEPTRHYDFFLVFNPTFLKQNMRIL